MNTIKTAIKYAFSSKNAQRTTSVMIILGLAVAMAAIIIIGSVVDLLQTKQIDVLKTCESFDAIIESSELKDSDLLSVPGVSEAYDFYETTVIFEGSALRIRGLDLEEYTSSERINEFFSFSDIVPGGILVSSYTYISRNINQNDTVNMTFLKKGNTATVVPYKAKLQFSGCFNCSEKTFSNTTAFVDKDTYISIMGEKDSRTGIFISSDPDKVIKLILQADPDARIITWQEYNKATYSALMLEKVLIYIFMSFMFIILCTGLKNSTQRLISNRKNEGAVLRALGATSSKVRNIFIVQGLVISLIGEFIGLLLGTAVVDNMEVILKPFFISSIFSECTYSVSSLAVLFAAVVLLSFIYTLIGCRALTKKEIMEVLLHETY